MSRLNYNKWDNLQLSDDSDIEVHPNVDKKSMIRWKQRDIHEKREQRKFKLKQFETEVPMNDSLLARIDSLIASTRSEGAHFVTNEVQRLKAALPYSYETKKFAEGEQPSEDHMIVSLLSQVVTGVQKKEQEEGKKDEAGRPERIVKELEWHRQRLVDRQAEIEKEKVEIAHEQSKWITSDDLRTGWDSKTIVSSTPSAQPQPASPVPSTSTAKPLQKKTETVIETLNSPAVEAAAAKAEESGGDSSDEADVPPLTPSALAFSKIAPLDWDSVKQAIGSDPSLLSEETGDALMVEAFSQAMKGTKAGEKRARECTEKALIGQYCRSLGRDGVALFFQRMAGGNQQALKIFLDDVFKTSQRIIDRAQVVAAERASKAASGDSEGVEQIQLVASSPDTTITFEVPDGPPPENLEITGEGSEVLDPQLVREFLQRRWDIFESFPKNLKSALTEKSLEKVNKVLGRMSVDEAEQVVEQLQEAGILSFEQPGVIDQTGKSGNETVTVPVPAKEESAPVQQTQALDLGDDLD
ncbi:Hsp90 co-chaperone CDC37 [Rhodotorula paludigena]|uniref:Hsp90 co-chaperone CDC37 n=1 Tax=Rhodotorula paludigena TaxID=86838 RepID=UPI00316DEF5D